MSEPIEVKGEQPEQQAPNGGRPHLVIALKEDGSLVVTGSINEKILAYGLLDSARDAIQDHITRMQKAQIVAPPKGGMMDFARRIRG